MFSSLRAKSGGHPSASGKNTSKVIVKTVETKKVKSKSKQSPKKTKVDENATNESVNGSKRHRNGSPQKHAVANASSERPKKIRKRESDRDVDLDLDVGPGPLSDSDSDNAENEADSFDRLSRSMTPNLEASDKHEKRTVALQSPQYIQNLITGEHLLHKSKGYIQLFDGEEEQTTSFELELPFGKERYEAVRPKIAEDFDPISEVEDIMQLIAAWFSPSTEIAHTIKDPEMKDCIIRRVRRAIRDGDRTKFLEAIDKFNALVVSIRDNGQLISAITKHNSIPLNVVSELLNQVYRRVVSPRSQELRHYEAFSSNVYGELLPSFVSDIFKDTKLESRHVFVDLGSGVGNCVLQAALQVGCESWGCEVMKTAGELAELQQLEFDKRVKAYGLVSGAVHLKCSDFTEDEDVKSALRRADTVLVNNYAFSAQLNDSLVNMFLDLKDGCRIVSLRSFVPQGHTISAHNIESPINILSVTTKQFREDSVSWTTAGGVYYVSTVDRTRLQRFLA